MLRANRSRKKLLLSQKASREKTREQIQEAMKNVQVGSVVTGKVSSIKSFGAFVNLGQVDGLVHISELSWDHVSSVEEPARG